MINEELKKYYLTKILMILKQLKVILKIKTKNMQDPCYFIVMKKITWILIILK